MYASALIDVSGLDTICRAILMLTINRSKVIQFRDRIAPDSIPAFLPTSMKHFTVFIR